MKKVVQIFENEKKILNMKNYNRKIIYKKIDEYFMQSDYGDIVFIELNKDAMKFIETQSLELKFFIKSNQLKLVLISDIISFDFLTKCIELNISAVIDEDYNKNNTLKLSSLETNHLFISPKLVKYLFEIKQLKIKYLNNYFTKRELEIIQLLITNLTYNEISNKLGLSINTIRMHIKNIYKKLAIKSKTNLILLFNNDSNLFKKLKTIRYTRLLYKISFKNKEKKLMNLNENCIENWTNKLRTSENRINEILDSI